MQKDDVARIAAGLDRFEREWLTGWQGVAGAAFNVVATSLLAKGLLVGPLDWNLSEKGEAVRNFLEQENRDDQ